MRTNKIFYVMSIILTFNLFSFDASSSTLNDFFPDLEHSLFKVQIQEFTDDGKVADSRDSLMAFKRDGNNIRPLNYGNPCFKGIYAYSSKPRDKNAYYDKTRRNGSHQILSNFDNYGYSRQYRERGY